MHTTNLRRVGGSVMLAVPPALLDILRLQSGDKIGITVEGGRLLVEPQTRKRYQLEELLAQCDAKAPGGKRKKRQEQDWLDAKPVGRELL